jgi:hypothetical protein
MNRYNNIDQLVQACTGFVNSIEFGKKLRKGFYLSHAFRSYGNKYPTNPAMYTTIGGHSVRYPWPAISDWAWYRNVRYRTEERRVRHYIGYRNKLLSDIRYPTLTFVNPCSAVVSCRIFGMKVVGSKPERKLIWKINLLGTLGNVLLILDIGISDIDLVRYRNGSWCRYRNYSDIGMKGFSPTFFVPISE